jgi:PAS domain S-box-containing protein
MKNLKKTLEVGPVKNVEYTFLKKDGSEFPVEMSASVIQDPSGKPMSFMGVIKDVSERKKVEQLLKESEEKFRTIFDSSTDGILLADMENKKFFTGNKTICNMLGYNVEEIKNLGVMEIHPKEDLPFVVEQFEKQARKEIGLAKNIPIKRKDGSVFYADINSAPMTLAGKTYLMGSFRDVTERKQVEKSLRESEERHRILFESAQDAIMTLEPPSWSFTSGNPATVKLFKAKNAEEFISYGPASVSPERQPDGRASAEKAKEMIETAMRDGSCFFEWTHKRITGEDFSATVLLSRVELGGKVFLQATVRDITQQKQLEIKLKEKIDDLELFKKLTVGRELKMVELKMEIEELNKKLKEEKKK